MEARKKITIENRKEEQRYSYTDNRNYNYDFDQAPHNNWWGEDTATQRTTQKAGPSNPSRNNGGTAGPLNV
jgi:hypothetical protein